MAKKDKGSDGGSDEPGLGLKGGAAKGEGAYRVLARKYRPQTFEDAFIGQAAMVRTLGNAFAADPGCGEAYTVIGYVRLFQRRHDEALEAGEKAVALCPNGTDAYHMTAMSHGYAGDFERAIRYEEQAQRLSPMELNVSEVDEARARFHLNDFKTARDMVLRVLKAKPRWLTAQSTLIASLWNLGQYEDARVIARKLLVVHPHFSVKRWGRGAPYRYDEHLHALLEPLRLAGLPD